MLIYVPRLSNRLGYTLKVVFTHILNIDYSVTLDKEFFEESNGPKLCYGDTPIGDAPFIKSHRLLFKTTIEEQEIRHSIFTATDGIPQYPLSTLTQHKPSYLSYPNQTKDSTAQPADGIDILFPTFGKQLLLPFDIFAATFFLISRYEEYLPHREDIHGRFLAHESIAYQYRFLQTAIVDRWAIWLYNELKTIYPDLPPYKRNFNTVATIDIDAAYCYQHKGLFRSALGMLRDSFSHHDLDEVKERIRVLCHKEKDPFDTFDFIISTKKANPSVKLLFFPLLGDYGVYDKPASFHNKHFRELLQHLGDYSKVGIHSSYNTLEKPHLIKKENQRLADILHRPIVRNRFHFLRLQLPKSYRSLIMANINHDYSMGYAEEPGFRAGTSNPYPFYDLERDEETMLTIHPFSLMDTTLFKYKGFKAEEALDYYKKSIDEIQSVNGTFCAIWHNQNLCDKYGWEHWGEVFSQTINYAAQKTNSAHSN